MAKKKCPNHPNNRIWSKGLCIICFRQQYAKPLKKTELQPMSQRQKNMLIVYRMLRRRYIREHPICEINLEGCTIQTTDVHHSGKKFTEDDWLDIKKFVGCCRSCHQKVENSPNLAKQLGIYNYKVTNDKKNNNDEFPLIDAESELTINGENNNEADTFY